MADYHRKRIISWALYDWANSAFATTVMAAFFPIFFKDYWDAGTQATVSNSRLGLANSASCILVALLAPLLGAVADRGGTRKKFLFFFALLGVAMTGGLYLVGRGQWFTAAFLYALASVGFSGSLIFYDSLLVGVTGEKKVDFVSALGYGLGYLGGGLLFGLNVAMVFWPQAFGLADQRMAAQVSFVSAALWWAVFSIPLFLWVDEPPAASSLSGWSAARAGFGQLVSTFRQIRRLRVAFLFLLGYWLYIDGVDTIIRMAAAYGKSLGFDSKNLLVALAITQAVGFPAAIGFGIIGEKWGAKKGIFIGLGVYIAVTIWGFFMDQVEEFYALAIAVGLVQGGVQSLSRSFFTRLIPPDKAAEFFGFYNMLGKSAAVLGPLLMAGIGHLTGDPRYLILSIIPLFIAGAALLYAVDETKAHLMAGNG